MANLKEVPEGNKGLSKLPTKVRNRMGFVQTGSRIKEAPTKGTDKSSKEYEDRIAEAQKEFEKATSNKRSSNNNTVNRNTGGSICARPTGKGKGAARSV